MNQPTRRNIKERFSEPCEHDHVGEGRARVHGERLRDCLEHLSVH